MRSIIILSILLLAVAVLARKDDVACVVHSDDCGKCVSNGCNWCSDGYCVSTESDMCEASKVSTQCGATIAKPVDKRAPTNNPCEANYLCGSCDAAAGCQICLDATTQIFKCSADTQCRIDLYALNSFDSWISRVVPEFISSFNFQPVNSCPAQLLAAENSPELRTRIPGVPTNQDGDMCLSFLQARILGSLRPTISPPVYTANHLIINATPTTKRQSGSVLADVRVKFADAGTVTAQGIAATIISNNPATYTVSAGTITVGPYLPSSGSGQAVSPSTSPTTSPDGSSKGVNISKGALAGIIIGCVLGGALLIAIIAWFILRRRDAYPQAFRSPAAAYRP